MKIFVTGSSGFIGTAICTHLEKEGYEVIRHDRGSNNYDAVLQCHTVIHLSAYGNHYHQKDVHQTIERNIYDLACLVEAAKESKTLQKFYNISTSSVTLPTHTMYSASKLFGETLINSLNDERFVNVRPYSVYGPGEASHRFIPTVIRHLKSGDQMKLDTTAVHDWIFISDFIESMLNGRTQIGTGQGHSNIEVVQMLEQISGKKLLYTEAKLRIYDNYRWVAPNTIPHRYNLYQGLKLTYESIG